MTTTASGPAVRGSDAPWKARVHDCRRPHAGARDRGEHGHLHGRQRDRSKPLPYGAPDRLVMVWQDLRARGGPDDEWLTPGNYADLRMPQTSWRGSRSWPGGAPRSPAWVRPHRSPVSRCRSSIWAAWRRAGARPQLHSAGRRAECTAGRHRQRWVLEDAISAATAVPSGE